MHSTQGEPIWRQIAGIVERDIKEGIYGPGDRLPTEAGLSKRFAVNRHTVRRAMAFLQRMGQIRIEQGRGTFVQSDLIEYPIGEQARFAQNVAVSNHLPGKTLLRAEQVRANATVARNLGIRKGASVVLLEAISEADGCPIGVVTHYFPAKRFANIIPAFRKTLSITEALKACGIDKCKRLSTRITAAMPTRQLAAHLQQSPTHPVLHTESITIDMDGRAIEYGVSHFSSDRTQLVVESEPLGSYAVLKYSA